MAVLVLEKQTQPCSNAFANQALQVHSVIRKSLSVMIYTNAEMAAHAIRLIHSMENVLAWLHSKV